MDINALQRRLREAPLDLFYAASSSTLHTFDKEWHSLCEDVDKASHLSLLNDEDMSLVYATATQIATWSSLLLKVDDEAAEKTASFMTEMEDVFAQLSISGVEHVTQHSSSPPPRYRRGSHSSSDIAPSYIPAAYSWILQNVHDPYPSTEIKARISRDAGRPLRVVTDWFKAVRRHIGWVSMCKTYFKGSRALAVQAAKHLLQAEPTSQLSVSSDIVSELGHIRTRLRNMYSISDDNGDLSDGTDDSFTPSSWSSQRFPSGQSPYASSRSSSSTPSLIFSTDDEDNHSLASSSPDDVSISQGKRKSFDENESGPLKRNRSGFISLVSELADIASAPAASASTDFCGILGPSPSQPQPTPSRKRRLSAAATEWEDATSTLSSLPQCGSRPPLRVPKRRLSVSDSQPTSKRPCLPPTVGPRKQVVSTPIPIAHQTTPVDDWFRTFELPDTPLSVELFSSWDVTIKNDVFLYDSLGSLQSDSSDPLNVTPYSDTYQLSTPLDLGVLSAVDPSVLDISSAFTEPPPPTQLTAPISSHPGPITATTTPVFDFLDAFLSAVNAESAEPYTTQSSSSPSTELSLNDTIDLFGESVVMP